MARIKVYTEEENRERKRARATRYNRAKQHREQTERWVEIVKFIRRRQYQPDAELASDLADKWRVMKPLIDIK